MRVGGGGLFVSRIVALDCLMEVLCALSDVSGEGCCGLLKGIEPPALSHGTANQFTSLAGVGRDCPRKVRGRFSL